mgnify:CR=1 FL=1
MNIQIINDFDKNKIYSAFDNIIIEFTLDQQPQSPIDYAEIDGLGYDVTLSPNPEGEFYFNFRVFSKSYITVDNLQDDMSYLVNTQDSQTFVKEDIQFMQGRNLSIKILLTDGTEIERQLILKYYRGVENLERFNHYFFVSKDDQQDYNPISIYYFEGYPIDIGVFTTELRSVGFATEQSPNQSNSLQINTFPIIDNYQFSRLILSDGFKHLKSTNGTDLISNISEIYITDFVENNFAVKIYNVVKIDSSCGGHYLKWLNRSGDYYYFLFSNLYEESIDSDSLGTINNDYSNKGYNPSPSLSKGKQSNREMTLFKQGVDAQMRAFLSDIIDSPRVYYYTGKKYERASKYDWKEVFITDNNFELTRPNEYRWNYFLSIEFPEYKNQTI